MKGSSPFKDQEANTESRCTGFTSPWLNVSKLSLAVYKTVSKSEGENGLGVVSF